MPKKKHRGQGERYKENEVKLYILQIFLKYLKTKSKEKQKESLTSREILEYVREKYPIQKRTLNSHIQYLKEKELIIDEDGYYKLPEHGKWDLSIYLYRVIQKLNIWTTDTPFYDLLKFLKNKFDIKQSYIFPFIGILRTRKGMIDSQLTIEGYEGERIKADKKDLHFELRLIELCIESYELLFLKISDNLEKITQYKYLIPFLEKHKKEADKDFLPPFGVQGIIWFLQDQEIKNEVKCRSGIISLANNIKTMRRLREERKVSGFYALFFPILEAYILYGFNDIMKYSDNSKILKSVFYGDKFTMDYFERLIDRTSGDF